MRSPASGRSSSSARRRFSDRNLRTAPAMPAAAPDDGAGPSDDGATRPPGRRRSASRQPAGCRRRMHRRVATRSGGGDDHHGFRRPTAPPGAVHALPAEGLLDLRRRTSVGTSRSRGRPASGRQRWRPPQPAAPSWPRPFEGHPQQAEAFAAGAACRVPAALQGLRRDSDRCPGAWAVDRTRPDAGGRRRPPPPEPPVPTAGRSSARRRPGRRRSAAGTTEGPSRAMQEGPSVERARISSAGRSARRRTRRAGHRC
jgi:hypothetical protein